jgi:O-antigen/teichoic acid export membrane protein
MSEPRTETWAAPPADGQLATVARNVSTRYVAIACEMVVGLVMLPFNLAHLGPTEYGLWVLLGSLTVHFSLLELGYGSGLVKFVAKYRALRDARALNEIASTLFCVFSGLGLIAYAIVAGIALNLDHVFTLSASQVETGKWILLIVGLYVAMNFPFSVYGGIISGFQRYDVNNAMAVGSSILVALTNVVVLLMGRGLIELVTATTIVRVLAAFVYRRNAFRVFPELHMKLSLFRRQRLRLTNQLNGVLFPTIVDSDTSQQRLRLQQILLQGTRISLAMVLPISAALVLLAEPLIRAWLGKQADVVAGCVPVLQILAVAVAVRVGSATGTTILKGTGKHRLLAWVNLSTGVVNAALSVLVIGSFGLIGVAWATLVPIAFSSAFILYPAACRRVGVPLRRAVSESIIPAVWPAFVVGALLGLSRDISTGTLLAVAFQTAVGGALYLALFFTVAISKDDRAYYIAKATALTRKRRLAPATSV